MYNIIQQAHSTKNGNYSKYEIGEIDGDYRKVTAIIAKDIADEDIAYDSVADENNWHVMNLWANPENGYRAKYIDSIAIRGAIDDDHAMSIANRMLDSMGADYADFVSLDLAQTFDGINSVGGGETTRWSLNEIDKLMSNPSQDKHYLPVITARELQTEQERATFTAVQWDDMKLVSHDGKEGKLLLDMTKCDTANELLAKFDFADTLEKMGATDELAFDSIVATRNKLGTIQNRLSQALHKASTDDLSVMSSQVTKPFKRQGNANIAISFDLSDGQSVTVFFMNPDSTPAKLEANAEMISWKWLLNKSDVTAVLQPRHGENVSFPQLAMRIMKLAHKNSKRFQRTQKKRAETEQAIADTEQLINEKNLLAEQLDSDIERLRGQVEEARANKEKAESAQEQTDNTILEDNESPTTPENYAKIYQSEADLKYHQDELDDFFQGRVIDVRNVLRSLGWEGEKFKPISKDGKTLDIDFMKNGAGGNVTGVTYRVTDTDLSLVDMLDKTVDEIAGAIDGVVGLTDEKSDDNQSTDNNLSTLTDKEVELIDKELDIPQKTTKKERKNVVKKWLVDNLLGKRIKTSDGKTVVFNSSQSINHLSFDGRRNDLKARAVTHIAEVFNQGEFVGIQKPSHERKDNIFQFHAYQKWVELSNGYKLLLEAHAGEREGVEELEIVAYSQKINEKGGFSRNYVNSTTTDEQLDSIPSPKSTTSNEDCIPIFDNMQDGEEVLFLILKVIDPDGNEVVEDTDNAKETEGGQMTGQTQQDTDYLQSILDGKVDVMADEFDDELTLIVERVGEDSELVKQVMDYYLTQLPTL